MPVSFAEPNTKLAAYGSLAMLPAIVAVVPKVASIVTGEPVNWIALLSVPLTASSSAAKPSMEIVPVPAASIVLPVTCASDSVPRSMEEPPL